MTKNRTMRVAALLLVLTLITSCFVGGTFAKYTATSDAESSYATVAKWDVKLNNNADFKVFTFDLFGTNTTSNNPVKIDPTSSGNFAIALTNGSDVNVQYSIDFNVEKTGTVPVKFSTDNQTWTDTLTDITNQTLPADGATTTVYWKWDAGSDALDTAAGAAAVTTAGNITVTATVSAEQVVATAGN